MSTMKELRLEIDTTVSEFDIHRILSNLLQTDFGVEPAGDIIEAVAFVSVPWSDNDAIEESVEKAIQNVDPDAEIEFFWN